MTCSSLLFLPHCSTLFNCLKLSFGSYWNYCPVICDCHTCTIQTTKIWGGKWLLCLVLHNERLWKVKEEHYCAKCATIQYYFAEPSIFSWNWFAVVNFTTWKNYRENQQTCMVFLSHVDWGTTLTKNFHLCPYVVVQFYPWLNFTLLCFRVRKCMVMSLESMRVKFIPRIKLNHNIYTWFV